MLCDNCKTERLVTDFINKQKFCYHCVYRIKLENTSKKRIPRKLFCRICGEEFVRKESLKKRQRTVFCSQECAHRGHKKQLNNHWTRKIRLQDSREKQGNTKWKTNRT